MKLNKNSKEEKRVIMINSYTKSAKVTAQYLHNWFYRINELVSMMMKMKTK